MMETALIGLALACSGNVRALGLAFGLISVTCPELVSSLLIPAIGFQFNVRVGRIALSHLLISLPTSFAFVKFALFSYLLFLGWQSLVSALFGIALFLAVQKEISSCEKSFSKCELQIVTSMIALLFHHVLILFVHVRISNLTTLKISRLFRAKNSLLPSLC
jgi:hypothetical protein